jgi:hypothetical protein
MRNLRTQMTTSTSVAPANIAAEKKAVMEAESLVIMEVEVEADMVASNRAMVVVKSAQAMAVRRSLMADKINPAMVLNLVRLVMDSRTNMADVMRKVTEETTTMSTEVAVAATKAAADTVVVTVIVDMVTTTRADLQLDVVFSSPEPLNGWRQWKWTKL